MALVTWLALAPRAAEAETSPKPTTDCPAAAKPMARLELLFGTKGKHGVVGPRAWKFFLAREVTPRFPAGLTVFEGYGQWRDSSGRPSREAARMLLVWYEPDARSEAAIEAIRAAYKKRFDQDSVLRAETVSCVAF